MVSLKQRKLLERATATTAVLSGGNGSATTRDEPRGKLIEGTTTPLLSPSSSSTTTATVTPIEGILSPSQSTAIGSPPIGIKIKIKIEDNIQEPPLSSSPFASSPFALPPPPIYPTSFTRTNTLNEKEGRDGEWRRNKVVWSRGTSGEIRAKAAPYIPSPITRPAKPSPVPPRKLRSRKLASVAPEDEEEEEVQIVEKEGYSLRPRKGISYRTMTMLRGKVKIEPEEAAIPLPSAAVAVGRKKKKIKSEANVIDSPLLHPPSMDSSEAPIEELPFPIIRKQTVSSGNVSGASGAPIERPVREPEEPEEPSAESSLSTRGSRSATRAKVAASKSHSVVASTNSTVVADATNLTLTGRRKSGKRVVVLDPEDEARLEIEGESDDYEPAAQARGSYKRKVKTDVGSVKKAKGKVKIKDEPEVIDLSGPSDPSQGMQSLRPTSPSPSSFTQKLESPTKSEILAGLEILEPPDPDFLPHPARKSSKSKSSKYSKKRHIPPKLLPSSIPNRLSAFERQKDIQSMTLCASRHHAVRYRPAALFMAIEGVGGVAPTGFCAPGNLKGGKGKDAGASANANASTNAMKGGSREATEVAGGGDGSKVPPKEILDLNNIPLFPSAPPALTIPPYPPPFEYEPSHPPPRTVEVLRMLGIDPRLVVLPEKKGGCPWMVSTAPVTKSASTSNPSSSTPPGPSSSSTLASGTAHSTTHDSESDLSLPCPHLEKTGWTWISWHRHLTGHLPDILRPFWKCPICKCVFARQDSFKRHFGRKGVKCGVDGRFDRIKYEEWEWRGGEEWWERRKRREERAEKGVEVEQEEEGGDPEVWFWVPWGVNLEEVTFYYNQPVGEAAIAHEHETAPLKLRNLKRTSNIRAKTVVGMIKE
ncbi:hypothetical protein SISSUDRAFT_1055788 [Sistotremastrum suecicum HHB10207 ss-3]|uniref:Uncharacterized protein n=1 Tax=Sistotremastrum suecicum HHB10207 ss-3 TaxID=1314776 RepID=A0A165XIT6_9AGAM|nr:hypothetical protein SISSUDRAFT_1055788 [Sistotremastrum suecicum HHB10207 ss-3]